MVFPPFDMHSWPASFNSSAEQQVNNPSDSTFDTMVDSAVDGFAAREGMSAAMDPEVNNMVNDEINKF